MQIQQRVAMKMREHMMKHMPQMSPSPDQQKQIQQQMLAHMRKEFQDHPDLAEKIEAIREELEEGKLAPIEANMRMRQAQQELMGRRMAHMMREKEQQARPQEGKKEDEEEAPMTKEVADEDL